MNSRTLALVTLALGLCACRSEPTERFIPPVREDRELKARPDPNRPRASVQRQFYGEGGQRKLEREVQILPGGKVVANGREVAWYPDGQLEYEQFFEQGQPTGVWKSWYPDGTPHSEVYCGATGSGTTTWWHENGVISSQGECVNGLKQGPWIQFYANGQKEAEGEYSLGQRNGYWRLWEESGEPKASGRYVEGARVGRWELWTDSGEVITRGSDDPPQ